MNPVFFHCKFILKWGSSTSQKNLLIMCFIYSHFIGIRLFMLIVDDISFSLVCWFDIYVVVRLGSCVSDLNISKEFWFCCAQILLE